MELLVSEVSILLKMLDQETLSSSVREKKTSVWNLLQQIQPSGGNDRQNVFKNRKNIVKRWVGKLATHVFAILFQCFQCDCIFRDRLHLHELICVQKWYQLCRVPL